MPKLLLYTAPIMSQPLEPRITFKNSSSASMPGSPLEHSDLPSSGSSTCYDSTMSRHSSSIYSSYLITAQLSLPVSSNAYVQQQENIAPTFQCPCQMCQEQNNVDTTTNTIYTNSGYPLSGAPQTLTSASHTRTNPVNHIYGNPKLPPLVPGIPIRIDNPTRPRCLPVAPLPLGKLASTNDAIVYS
jgi:hypothetical protein